MPFSNITVDSSICKQELDNQSFLMLAPCGVMSSVPFVILF